MNTQNNWEKDFELDVEAHAKGRCSFSLPSLCSAEEQRVKMLIRSLLSSERERLVRVVGNLSFTAAWRNDKEMVEKAELLNDMYQRMIKPTIIQVIKSEEIWKK